MRLIDADAAVELIKERQRKLCPLGLLSRRFVFDEERERYDQLDNLIDAIDAIPTVDAEPVIYCKDCAYGKVYDGKRFCECMDCDDVPDDCYCYYAKRKEEDRCD